MTVRSYNVRGLRARAKLVAELMGKQCLDLLAIQETLLPPEARPPVGYKHEAVMNGGEGAREAKGGSCPVLRDGLKYDLLAMEITDGQELIAVRLGDLVVIVVYIRVHHNVTQMVVETMKRVNELGRGRCFAISDIKSRNLDWCTNRNGRGVKLR